MLRVKMMSQPVHLSLPLWRTLVALSASQAAWTIGDLAPRLEKRRVHTKRIQDWG